MQVLPSNCPLRSCCRTHAGCAVGAVTDNLLNSDPDPEYDPAIFLFLNGVTLAQNQCSAKSEIFFFQETSDECKRPVLNVV